jgi:hypothetical protein
LDFGHAPLAPIRNRAAFLLIKAPPEGEGVYWVFFVTSKQKFSDVLYKNLEKGSKFETP